MTPLKAIAVVLVILISVAYGGFRVFRAGYDIKRAKLSATALLDANRECQRGAQVMNSVGKLAGVRELTGVAEAIVDLIIPEWTIPSPQTACLQSLVQLSVLIELASSHCSSPWVMPSPQARILQVVEHPLSPLSVARLALPSSHCSPAWTMPSPQLTSTQSREQGPRGLLPTPSSHCSTPS